MSVCVDLPLSLEQWLRGSLLLHGRTNLFNLFLFHGHLDSFQLISITLLLKPSASISVGSFPMA